MDAHSPWQEELFDISLALEEEALILRYRALLPANEAISSEIDARLFCRLADYLMQHAADLRLISKGSVRQKP